MRTYNYKPLQNGTSIDGQTKPRPAQKALHLNLKCRGTAFKDSGVWMFNLPYI